MAEKTPEEIANEVFKFEMKASSKMQTLAEETDQAQIEEAFVESFQSLADTDMDPNNAGLLVSLMQQFGAELGSQRMVDVSYEFAQEHDDLDVTPQ